MIRGDNIYCRRMELGLMAARKYPSRTAAAKALNVHRHTLLRWMERKAGPPRAPVVLTTEQLVQAHERELVTELDALRREVRVLKALVEMQRHRQEA